MANHPTKYWQVWGYGPSRPAPAVFPLPGHRTMETVMAIEGHNEVLGTAGAAAATGRKKARVDRQRRRVEVCAHCGVRSDRHAEHGCRRKLKV